MKIFQKRWFVSKENYHNFASSLYKTNNFWSRWLSSNKKDFINLQNWKEVLWLVFYFYIFHGVENSMRNFLKFSIHRIFAHQNGLFDKQTFVKKNFYQIFFQNIFVFSIILTKIWQVEQKFMYNTKLQHFLWKSSLTESNGEYQIRKELNFSSVQFSRILNAVFEHRKKKYMIISSNSHNVISTVVWIYCIYEKPLHNGKLLPPDTQFVLPFQFFFVNAIMVVFCLAWFILDCCLTYIW